MKIHFFKLKFLFLIVLFFGIFGLVKNTWAATITARSCNVADIQSAIDSAAIGDTINVPAGACTWENTLNVNKAVKIMGAGASDNCPAAGKTCITAGWASTENRYLGSNYMLYVYVYSTGYAANYDKELRISGFTFDMNNTTSGLYLLHGSATYPLNKFMFDNNIMKNDPCSAYPLAKKLMWTGYGEIYGVIYNNKFTGYVYMTMVSGNGGWGVTGKYPGSTKALFFEDNELLQNKLCMGSNDSAVPGVDMGTGLAMVTRLQYHYQKYTDTAF